MYNSKVHSLLSNQITLINDQVTKINSGGCGIAALSLHKALTNQSIRSEIVLVSIIYDRVDIDCMIAASGATDINECYNNMLGHLDPDWDTPDNNTCNGHICVQVDGILYDSNGVFYGHAISDGITEQTMELFVSIKECWNDHFRYVNEYNDDITETFDVFFGMMLAGVNND